MDESEATSKKDWRLRLGVLNGGGTVDFRKAPVTRALLELNTAGVGATFVTVDSETKPLGVKPAPMIVIVCWPAT